jgi:putative heme-binding domain-containing protein
VLELTGDAMRGAAIYEKSCSKCHRINGVGHNVGPDISDTRARARDALLYDILDPNRRVDPQFTEYIVITTDGRLFNGLMIAESTDAVTLRQPEGREQTILRSDIEELKSSSKSLMPEGIERDVTVEQMADLLEFLKAR